MGIEHQGDVNDQVEGPGSGSDSPNVEQPELADIQQLNKAGGSAQADSVLRSANLELVDDSSEPVMIARADTGSGDRQLMNAGGDREEGARGNDRVEGGNERFRFPERTQPGVDKRPDGSTITFESIGGKVVPTQIKYKNGVTTDFGYEDGKMVSVKNSAGGRVFQELELKNANRGEWRDKTNGIDLKDVNIKVDMNGIDTNWKDTDGKSHNLRVNRDASTIMSTKQGDGEFKPTMVINSEIPNAATTFEYDDDGNMVKVNNHSGFNEKGKPNEPVQQYESKDGGKTFELKIAPPGSPSWKVLTEVSVDKNGTFKAKGSTGQSMEWKANSRIPTFK